MTERRRWRRTRSVIAPARFGARWPLARSVVLAFLAAVLALAVPCVVCRVVVELIDGTPTPGGLVAWRSWRRSRRSAIACCSRRRPGSRTSRAFEVLFGLRVRITDRLALFFVILGLTTASCCCGSFRQGMQLS